MVKMPRTTQATIRACTQCLSESYVDPYITSVNHPDYLQLHLLLATAVKVCAGKERATIFLRYYERLRAYVEDVQQTTNSSNPMQVYGHFSSQLHRQIPLQQMALILLRL